MSHRSREVDAYIDNLSAERKQALTSLRELVFEIVPGADENMQYRMPTYAYQGHKFCAFASQKNYISLYIMNTKLVDEHRQELAGLDVGKSCIRFRKWEKLPVETIRQILEESV